MTRRPGAVGTSGPDAGARGSSAGASGSPATVGGPAAAASGSPAAAEPRVARDVWLVLARRKYDEPLCQVGTVTADDPDLAVVFARSIYDEHPWIEMVVVPRSSLRTAIAP